MGMIAMSDVKVLAAVEGTVIKGKQVGTKLGVPTANIPYPRDTSGVPDGIYAAEMELLDQGRRVVRGVLNQGYHPTVPGGDPAVEVHLFDFYEDLYGQRVRVNYLAFLRPEVKFDSKEAMRQVIMDDIRRAKEWFADHPDDR